MNSPIDGADQPTERIPRVGARHYPAAGQPSPTEQPPVAQGSDDSSAETAAIPHRAVPPLPATPQSAPRQPVPPFPAQPPTATPLSAPSPSASPLSASPRGNVAREPEFSEPTPTRIMPAVPFDIAPPSDRGSGPFPGGPLDAGQQDPDEDAAPAYAGGRFSRILIATAGVLSAGLLLLGIALLVLKFVVPAVRTGDGLDESYGPGTGQIIAHLVVGAAGESTRLLRRRGGSAGVHTVVAAVVILAVLAVLWWSWWY